MYEWSYFFTSSPAFCVCVYFIFYLVFILAILIGVWQYFIVVFICIFIMVNGVKHLLCAYMSSVYPLWRNVSSCLLTIFWLNFLLFHCWVWVLCADAECQAFVRRMVCSLSFHQTPGFPPAHTFHLDEVQVFMFLLWIMLLISSVIITFVVLDPEVFLPCFFLKLL